MLKYKFQNDELVPMTIDFAINCPYIEFEEPEFLTPESGYLDYGFAIRFNNVNGEVKYKDLIIQFNTDIIFYSEKGNIFINIFDATVIDADTEMELDIDSNEIQEIVYKKIIENIQCECQVSLLNPEIKFNGELYVSY